VCLKGLGRYHQLQHVSAAGLQRLQLRLPAALQGAGQTCLFSHHLLPLTVLTLRVAPRTGGRHGQPRCSCLCEGIAAMHPMVGCVDSHEVTPGRDGTLPNQ
jgi:hypothetical protein